MRTRHAGSFGGCSGNAADNQRVRTGGAGARVLGSVLALAIVAANGGCGGGSETERREPVEEGQTVEIGGIDYQVELARQLNINIPPDSGYFNGPPAPSGSLYFGVFLKACNTSDEPRPATGRFRLVNAFEEELKPIELPDDNPFAFRTAPDPGGTRATTNTLAPNDCIPEPTSVAARAAPGAMLLFQVPREFFRNAPLKLEIEGPKRGEEVVVELDV